jgi:hypothetical protein
LPLFAESDRSFFAKAVEAQLEFLKGGDGKVTALILHQNGADQRMRRLEDTDVNSHRFPMYLNVNFHVEYRFRLHGMRLAAAVLARLQAGRLRQ